jgi:hypothetical protein
MSSELSAALDSLPALTGVRDRLEAVIWRLFPGATAEHVDCVLAAADAYAVALVAETRDRVLARMRLAEATAEYTQARHRGRIPGHD